jgi:hypothetical protein
MRRVGHVDGRCRVVVGKWGNLREGEHSEDLGVDGRIVKCIFKKWDVETLTGLIWLRIWIGDGSLCIGSEPLVSIKYGEFFDWLRTYLLLKFTLLHGVS